MQELFHLDWRSSLLLAGLLLAGCGGGEDGTTRVVSTAASITDPQQASSRVTAPDTPSQGDKSPVSAVKADTAAAALESASLAQLSALPHLSALSAREKAGLLLLLPSKSNAQRLALIEMYPSLSQLPIQQKQVLLDKLEKIVPVADNQRR